MIGVTVTLGNEGQVRVIRRCDICGEEYEAVKPSSRYCSARCRNRKARGAPVVAELPKLAAEGEVSALFRRDLEAASRLETPRGALAMAAARRIDGSTSLMGYSTLLKQARELFDAAIEGAQAVNDPVDELQARRDRTRAG